MKVVIDISDNDYEYIKGLNEGITDYHTTVKLYRSVRGGTVLPKCHGRLYDEKVLHDYWGEKYDLPHIPCVIEADKENEE